MALPLGIDAVPRPSIVLIVVDDMGYHNLHAPPLHVSGEIRTPALARFAASGVSLSNFIAYKYCGPSRASLLTGRLPGHGISEQMWSPAERAGYNANLTMLPARLKSLGYATHAFGKWHCGFYSREFLPTSRGFDSFVGYLTGMVDHYTERAGDTCNRTGRVVGTDMWRDGESAIGLNSTLYADLIYTSAAVATIERHARSSAAPSPLFLYLALQSIHGPDQAPDSFLAQYDPSLWPARRMKDAMASVADESVANVSAALDGIT